MFNVLQFDLLVVIVTVVLCLWCVSVGVVYSSPLYSALSFCFGHRFALYGYFIVSIIWTGTGFRSDLKVVQYKSTLLSAYTCLPFFHLYHTDLVTL